MLTNLGRYRIFDKIKSLATYILSILPLPSSKLIIIAGKMRTGSTYIQETVANSTGGFNAHQWVFDHKRLFPFAYLKGYRRFIRLRGYRIVVVKLLMINTVLYKDISKYANDFELKSFIEYVLHKNSLIICLVRENVFEQSVSQLYAEKTQTWALKDQQELKSIRLDPLELKKVYLKNQEDNKYFNDQLSSFTFDKENLLRMSYEEFFAEERELVLKKLQEFLQVDQIVLSGYQKILKNPKYTISNLAELEEIVKMP